MLDFLQTDAGRVVVLALMAIAAMTIVYDLVKLVRSVIEMRVLTKAKSERILWIISGLYGLGVTAKFAIIGPSWFRWHVADIGFPVMLLLALTALMARQMKPAYGKAKTVMDISLLNLGATTARFKLLAVALTVSVGYEIFVGLFIPRFKSRGAKDLYIGGFDWFDILCYIFGSLLAAAVLLYQRWIDKLLLNADLADRAQEARQRTEAQHHRTSERRKAYDRQRRVKK